MPAPRLLPGLLLLAAGCRLWTPPRLLILDFAAPDSVAAAALAAPWIEGGYDVDFRPYDAHPAPDDRTRYRAAVVLLGGAAAPDTITPADFTRLTEWLRDGGVVVAAYPVGPSGTRDRARLNAWLDRLSAGVTIGGAQLADSTAAFSAEPAPPATPVPDSPLREAGFDAFPFGRNDPLEVQSRWQVLARTTRSAYQRAPGSKSLSRSAAAVVAARRVGDGMLIVLARDALAAPAGGEDGRVVSLVDTSALAGSRVFLTALARWTRRPAEWGLVPVARPPRTAWLTHAGRGGTIPALQPAAPQRTIPLGSAGPPPPQANAPAWVTRSGARALLTSATLTRTGAVDSLAEFLDAGGFTILATLGVPRGLGDALQTTNVRWIPFLDPGGFTPDSVACALDPRWWDAFGTAYQAAAHGSAAWDDLVPAVGLDLSRRRGAPFAPGFAFCDSTYAQVLSRLRAEPRLDSVPRDRRYEELRDAGRLDAYLDTLQTLVTARAAGIASAARMEHPDLLFAARADSVPADWFTVGLIAGFARGGEPVLLFTGSTAPAALLGRYRARGIRIIHLVRLPTPLPRVPDWLRARPLLFDWSDGFWLDAGAAAAPAGRTLGGNLRPDSLARLLRRLAR
ncbi:MAG TPA: DUF4350 domain-containing protein [Gemmatimonadales bacterium]|nr:DUF4350 domain-containing protein [Gemmatimonadales bacterium]